MIEKGDLVVKKGKHEAKVYFVEGIDDESILLVNGIRDEYFEGEKDIELFHKQFRLLAKAEHLIEEEKKYRLKLASKLFTESIENIYLNQNLQAPDRYYVNSAFDGLGMKTIFTESEIAQMDITGFEKIEVSE